MTPITPPPAELEEQIPIYDPTQVPWQVDALACTDPVMLLSGSTGGGKSKCALEKVHALCLAYPKTTVVTMRKNKLDAMKSIKVNLKNNVIGNDPRVKWNHELEAYEYWNGSYLFVYGMKDEKAREGLRSIGPYGRVEYILMEEAIEFEEVDFNESLTRLRGTSSGWTQIILCTNPGPMLHWINRRLIIGREATVFISGARDNKYNPASYHTILNTLTGITKARLVDGLWIDGEGRVVDTWVDDYNHKTGKHKGGNVRLEADYIPRGGPVVLLVDDGYAGEFDEVSGMFTGRSHPRSILLAQLRTDGRFAVFYEDYRVKVRHDVHLEAVLAYARAQGWPRPRTAFYDKAAASVRGALEDLGFWRIYPSSASVSESLKELVYSVGKPEGGMREFIVHPRCVHLCMEFPSYAYDSNGNIIKQFDHGIDASRTMVWCVKRGDAMPSDIGAGDESIDVRLIQDAVEEAYEEARKIIEKKLESVV